MKKTAIVFPLAIILLFLAGRSAVSLFSRTGSGQIVLQQGQPTIPKPLPAFLIRFGLRDNVETSWDGTIKITDGRIASLQGWRLEEADSVDFPSLSWKCKTRIAVFNTRVLFNASPTPNLVNKGILITLDSGAGGSVEVKTTRGSFAFKPSEIQAGSQHFLLDGQVSVEPIISAQRVTDDSHQDDYPSVLFDGQKRFWTAWIAYHDAKDIVRARYQNTEGRWSETFDLSDWGDHYQTTLALDDRGRIWAFWSSQVNKNWDVYGRSFDGVSWSSMERITESPEPDLFPKAVTSADGTLYLAWQGFRQGQSDVLLKSFKGRRWSEELRVSESSANDWQPSLAAGPGNKLWIAWDSYANGNYDVFLRGFQDGALGKTVAVAATPLFEAQAAVTVDAQGNPWVAWEEGGMNWGKDWARDDMFRGSLLYFWRRSSIARVGSDGVKITAAPLQHALPEELRRYQQLPQPVFDAQGRLWVFFRVRTSVIQDRYDGWSNGGRWESFVTRYDGDRWFPAIYLADSVGGSDVPLAVAAAADGFRLAWSSDQRPFRLAGGFGARFVRNNSVFLSSIFSQGWEDPSRGSHIVSSPMLKELTQPGQQVASPVHPGEKEDLQRIRNYQIPVSGKTLHVYRGDLHRHTDISQDGAGDGSLLDLYRYSMDAASLDYILVSDHNMGGDDEYSWWRTQKSNDLFEVGTTFVPLYGYERSVAYPNGHRNVIFLERGVRTLPIQAPENQGKINTGSILYPHLRENKGITTSHSGATGQGSDWRDWDLGLEPIVELYQGYHASYEYEGAPKAETDRFIQRIHGGYEPAGFWWNALKKGYKLGVQASSDHIATHTSYACIYAPENTRTSLMDAMKARHTYAATDNIVLDFRAVADGREYMMGDIFTAKQPPKFTVKVEGTAKITELVLIRNEKFLYTLQPNKKSEDLTLLDTQPLNDQEAWYYVRVQQDDKQMAWSSPIWITVKTR